MKVSAPRIRQRVLRGGRLLIIWCFIGLAIVLLLLGPDRLAYAFLAWFWS